MPRVLQFLVDADVQNIYPEHGIQQGSVGLFEEGWATREFAELPKETRSDRLLLFA